ncbi:MAG: hypothetical protein U5R48_09640 [Gammaproteobacteria bacterium]|nr:hypothetical protein [Gammaproteobacteria bacterium]
MVMVSRPEPIRLGIHGRALGRQRPVHLAVDAGDAAQGRAVPALGHEYGDGAIAGGLDRERAVDLDGVGQQRRGSEQFAQQALDRQGVVVGGAHLGPGGIEMRQLAADVQVAEAEALDTVAGRISCVVGIGRAVAASGVGRRSGPASVKEARPGHRSRDESIDVPVRARRAS